jgi:hypothetical protein
VGCRPDTSFKYNLDDAITGRLPVELQYAIIEFYLDGIVPTRGLALVCKQWRAWMQGTPALWRNLHAFHAKSDKVDSQSLILTRRIVLSGSTLLNVTLDITYYDPIRCYRPDLFHVIARTGLERWQTLLLDSGRNEYCSIISLDRVFKGKFTSLQSLDYSIEYSRPFKPIEELVVQSNPSIKIAKFRRDCFPQNIYGTSTLQQVSELHANSATIERSGPYPELRKIHASIYPYEQDIDPMLFPPLPPHTQFSFRLNRSRLATLQLQMVENLVLDSLKMGDDDEIIEFPNLVSLVIEEGGLSTIRRISAPKLTFLQLSRHIDSFCPHPYGNAFENILPDNRGERLLVMPTSVILGIMVSTVPAIIALLEWPQIEHLSMRLHDSSWDLFMENFESAKICPNLKTLTLFLLSGDNTRNGLSSRCDGFVKRAWEVRQGSPLQVIKWIPYFKEGMYWHKRDAIVYPAVNVEIPNFFASMF